MGQKNDVPVFTETNLGTRIAIAVSPDITVGNFKRELERAHVECFPELGFPYFKTVMVKHKSKIYCLSDLLPLRTGCFSCKKVWFVSVFGCLSNELGKFRTLRTSVPERTASKCHKKDSITATNNFANNKPKKRKVRRTWCQKAVQWGLLAVAYPTRKKKKKKRRYMPNKFSVGKDTLEQECLNHYGKVSSMAKGVADDSEDVLHPTRVLDSNSTAESPCESFSGAISVSGIINRYFSNLLSGIDSPSISEVASRAGENVLEGQGDAQSTASVVVDSNSMKRHSMIKATKKLLPSTLLEDCNSVAMRRKYERTDVGKRLVIASNVLQLCQSKQNSQKSNFLKGNKFREPDAHSVAKCLIFEIDDDDDD